MSDENKDDLEPVTMRKGPGELLQVARIEQSISIDDIARQMNLNAKILQSIEDDDYSDIQSPIFMRGYLRTYARLVGLDEDKMIRMFSDFYQQDDPVIKAIGNTIPEISSNDIRVKWMTYAVILGLLVLLSIWWVNNYRADLLGGEATSSSNSMPTETSKIVASQNDRAVITPDIKMIEPKSEKNEMSDVEKIITTDSDLANTSIAKDDTAEQIVEEISPEQEATSVQEIVKDKNTEVVVLNEGPALTEVSEVVEPVKEDIKQLKETVAATQTLSVKKKYTKETSAPSGSDVLELNIVAASWGNIKDASKFKLVQDLLKAGTSYRLIGEAPFNIFLGNGYGVEITLNGRSIDFSKHIKSSNNTARFELEK